MEEMLRKYGPWVFLVYALFCLVTYLNGDGTPTQHPTIGGYLTWVVFLSQAVAQFIFWPLLGAGIFVLLKKSWA